MSQTPQQVLRTVSAMLLYREALLRHQPDNRRVQREWESLQQLSEWLRPMVPGAQAPMTPERNQAAIAERQRVEQIVKARTVECSCHRCPVHGGDKP